MIPEIQIGDNRQETLSHRLSKFKEAVLKSGGTIQLVVHPYAIDEGEIPIGENGEIDPHWVDYINTIDETLDNISVRTTLPTIILSEQGMTSQAFSEHFNHLTDVPEVLCLTTNNGDPVPYTDIHAKVSNLHNTLYCRSDWTADSLKQIGSIVDLAVPDSFFEDIEAQDAFMEEADRRFIALRNKVNILAWNQLGTFMKDLGIKHVKLAGRNLFIKPDGSMAGCIAEVAIHLQQQDITTELTDAVYTVNVTGGNYKSIEEAA